MMGTVRVEDTSGVGFATCAGVEVRGRAVRRCLGLGMRVLWDI